MLLVSALLLCCCAAQKHEESIPPVSKSKEESKLEPQIAELKRLYEAAQSQYERREVSLRAIDERSIEKGEQVASVDAILGTNFASNLPKGGGATEVGVVYFGTNVTPPPRPDGKTVAIGYIGWSMQLEYDDEGKIQNYFMNNLWKGHSSYEQESKGRTSILELRGLYEDAQSERERRAACLRALDEGVIHTYGPVSTIDALFGTQLASQLPTEKEGKRTGVIDFVSHVPISPNPEVKTEAAGQNGWFMAVEYDYNGNIQNYYLTNVRK